MTTETGEASFTHKMDRNRYKVRQNQERSIDSFDLSHMFSTKIELEFKKNGIVLLLNQDELRK